MTIRLIEVSTFAPHYPYLNPQHRRALYQQYFDLPIKIHTAGGTFSFSRGRNSWCGLTLQQAYAKICELLELENERRRIWWRTPSR